MARFLQAVVPVTAGVRRGCAGLGKLRRNAVQETQPERPEDGQPARAPARALARAPGAGTGAEAFAQAGAQTAAPAADETAAPAADETAELVAALARQGIAAPACWPAMSPLQRRFRAALRTCLSAPDAAIAEDPASRALLAEAGRAAASSVTVLIEGPSGSGKEVLARHIHARSSRARGPFVAVNCAAIPEAMLESLLFGHERGAFTGAQGASIGLFRAADGGTLFLDELGELPGALQAKLLRVIQEREVLPLGALRPVPVDVRLVTATNRDLGRDAAEGRFREDLYWRLAVFPLKTLPLARRPGDILPLAAAFLLRFARQEQARLPVPDDCALEALLDHDFPGNARELDNRLQRAAILAGGAPIARGHLGLEPRAAGLVADASPRSGEGLIVAVRQREAEAIREAIAATGGRKGLAAARLGISERTLRYKLAALAGRPRASQQGAARAARGGSALQ